MTNTFTFFFTFQELLIADNYVVPTRCQALTNLNALDILNYLIIKITTLEMRKLTEKLSKLPQGHTASEDQS